MTKLTVKQRFALLIMADSLIVTFSVFLGYYILEPYFQNYSRNLLLFSSVSLLITHHIYAYIFNIYHRAWEYASVTELILIVKSVTYAVLTTMFIVFLLMNGSVFIRLYLITWMMNLILIGGSRLSWRVYRRAVMKNDYKKIPTLIVGAGQGGLLLMRQMTRNPYMGIEPVAIVDDDPNKQNMSLTSNIKVEGTIDDIPSLVKRYQIKKLIIAIPTLSKARLKDISALTGNLNIEVLKMPNIENVMTGEVEVSQLKKCQ